MTIEYVLLIIAAFFIGLKAFLSVPAETFRNSGPMLGARIEKQLATGTGFEPKGTPVPWSGE